MKSSKQKFKTNQHYNQLETGIVIKKMPGVFLVETNDVDHLVSCTLASNLYKTPKAGRQFDGKKKHRPTHEPESQDTVVVGDQVFITHTHNGSGEIVEISPRRNKLSRRSAVPMPDARPHEQVIVANVDLVIPVLAAANPAPKWNLLDRYLVLAEALELPALICITKLDLAMDDHGTISEELEAELNMYRKLGYPVVMTSSVNGQGVNDLREHLHGRLSVFLGKSGVGKTALLNAVQPGLGLRVREVSRISGKGKHTTTYMEMFPLSTGGRIIDTPGVQEFGLWDIADDELIEYFPEMRPFLGKCRFGLNCQHDEEPDCAIRRAVMRDQISPRRYQSYLNLIQEIRYDEHRLS